MTSQGRAPSLGSSIPKAGSPLRPSNPPSLSLPLRVSLWWARQGRSLRSYTGLDSMGLPQGAATAASQFPELENGTHARPPASHPPNPALGLTTGTSRGRGHRTPPALPWNAVGWDPWEQLGKGQSWALGVVLGFWVVPGLSEGS